MAPAPIIPIVTTSATPIVTVVSPLANVSSPTVSYNQILQSLGTYIYGAEFIYLATNTYTQISQPFQYNHFDSNGNQITTYLPFTVDPYQNQPSIYFETNPDEIVLDGFSSLTFNLEPNNIVYFKTFVLVTSTSGFLDDINPSNFKQVEKAEGVKFFDDFCNYLIDEEDVTKA
jgi:hypothetical protein